MIDSKDFNQLKADKVDDPNSDKPIDPRFYFSAAEYNALLLRVQELSKFQDRSSNMGIRILGRKSSLEDLDKVISPRLGDAYLINDNLWIYDGISNTKPYGWSNIGKIHGTGREVIYKRTLEYITPDTPEAEDNERQTDNDYPKDWTGAPLGAVVSEPYEWESVRTRGTGVWSEYSEPAIHSKYTESGKMIKLTSSSNIIKKSLDGISPEVITVKGMAIGDVEISTWLYKYNEAPGGYSILVPGKSHIVGVVLTGDTITIDTKAFLQANSDFETIEFKTQDTTESIYDIEGITKLIQGDDVRLTLNNSNTSVGVTSEGVAYNYDDTDVYLKTYQGTNKLVYDKVGINIGTYKVEITVSEGVKGVDFESPLPEIINGDCWVDDITNMKNGVNSSYREFIVTGTDLNNKAFGPLTIRQQIRAVKDGDDGIDGIDGIDGNDGIDGEDAYSVKLSKEQHIFIFNNQNDILPKGGWDKGNVEVSASKGSKTYTCNSFTVGERPSLPNTYTVKSISKNGISSYETSLYKSNFQFYPIGLSNPDGNNSLTLQVETLDDNAIYKTFEVTVKYERVNDGLAGLGVPVTFRGDWDEAKKYYGSDIRLDITKYGNMYYKTRNFSGSETIGVVTGPPNVDIVHWEEFGEYFESVATSLLYAEQANIANFAFSEETMYSQSGYLTNADGSVDYTRPQEDGDSTLPNFRSNLLLRGKTGELQALTGYIGGFNISKGRLMSTKGTTPSLILDGVAGTISVGETVKIQSSGTISNLAKWSLYADGSGYLANNNLRWNSDGTLLMGLAPTGKDGVSGSETLTTEFSITGNGDWHTNYAAEDKYMRSRVGNGLWKDVVRIVGEVFPIEFSVNGSTSWHVNYFDGDLYKRVKIDGVWGSPIKLTLNPTPLKPFKEYQFANNTSSSTPPTTSSSSWIDSPTPLTTEGQHMWMRARTVTYNTIIPTNPPTNPNYIEPYSYGAWETPSRITKLTGYSPIDISSAIRFNPNGSGYLANGNILWDTIGNATIKGIYKSNNEEILLRPDGSGHLASGDISWDENGDVIVKGDIESVDSNGDKLTITNAGMRIDGFLGDRYTRMGTSSIDMSSSTNGTQVATITASPHTTGAYFATKLPDDTWRRGSYKNDLIQLDFGGTVERFVVQLGSTSSDNLQVIMRNLPTSPEGLLTGQLYKDTNGFLKVV